MTAIDINVPRGGPRGGGITARLRRFLASGPTDVRPAELFADWRPADIANVLGGFQPEEAARILMVLPPRQRAAIVVYFDPGTRSAIGGFLPPRLREDLEIRSDRLARRHIRQSGCGTRSGKAGPMGRRSRRDGHGVQAWATNMALDAATALLRRGHRIGVIGPARLARGLIKVAGWRGRLRRQSNGQSAQVAAAVVTHR